MTPEELATLVAEWPDAAGLAFGPSDLSDDVVISTTIRLGGLGPGLATCATATAGPSASVELAYWVQDINAQAEGDVVALVGWMGSADPAAYAAGSGYRAEIRTFDRKTPWRFVRRSAGVDTIIGPGLPLHDFDPDVFFHARLDLAKTATGVDLTLWWGRIRPDRDEWYVPTSPDFLTAPPGQYDAESNLNYDWSTTPAPLYRASDDSAAALAFAGGGFAGFVLDPDPGNVILADNVHLTDPGGTDVVEDFEAAATLPAGWSFGAGFSAVDPLVSFDGPGPHAPSVESYVRDSFGSRSAAFGVAASTSVAFSGAGVDLVGRIGVDA